MKLVTYTKRSACFLLLGAAFSLNSATARTIEGLHYGAKPLEVEIRLGANIGGTSPLPLPAEIREINSFNPRFNPLVEFSVTRWLTKDTRWAFSYGFRVESKGMNTGATVKNYGMEIIQEESRVSGNWTGQVRTHYQSTFLTIPVLANYRINDRLKVNIGPYFSYALSKNFNGEVFDGYLREGDPTGDKVVFEDGAEAEYDFGKDLRTFQWGAQAGVSWLAYKHITLQADLTWGLNDIFKSSFKTVTFSMYPIYLHVGVGYLF